MAEIILVPVPRFTGLLWLLFMAGLGLWALLRLVLRLWRREPPVVYPSLIHLSDWAGQGDIHILCTDVWTEPAWGKDGGRTDVANVYRTTEGTRYTFERAMVTCPKCLTRLPLTATLDT